MKNFCLTIAFSALLAALGSAVGANDAEKVQGRAIVTDGDSIRIDGIRIRLDGIDAPERRQKCEDAKGKAYFCGQESMQALATLIGEGSVHCIKKESDRYGRLLAQCYSNNIDLGAEQVRKGWAVAYRKYRQTYVAIEEQARKAKSGIWAGAFEMPWNWRRKNR